MSNQSSSFSMKDLYSMVTEGHTTLLRACLDRPQDFRSNPTVTLDVMPQPLENFLDHLLVMAVKTNQEEAAQVILDYVPEHIDLYRPIELAVSLNHTKMAEIFLSHNSTAHHNDLIKICCKKNFADMLQLLLDYGVVIDPEVSMVVEDLVLQNSLEATQVVLNDPNGIQHHNRLFFMAAARPDASAALIDCLYDFELACKAMEIHQNNQSLFLNPVANTYLQQKHQAEMERRMLDQEVGHMGRAHNKKKI